jgi:hypothetical protein
MRGRKRDGGLRIFGALNQTSNRAFFEPPSGLLSTLKNRQKTLFLQEFADRDFALGAPRLSWHK